MDATRRIGWTLCCLVPLSVLAFWTGVGQDVQGQPASSPKPAAKSPEEEKKTFQLAPGFQIDLVASEPQVVDPVAMAFDTQGRLFVAELRGYPNGGVAGGNTKTGVVKMLEDKDGDGFFETSTIFADNLGFPTSVMPYKGGLLVAVAPDLIYLEDRNGDGKADSSKTLYTGFGVDNIEQLLNGLQWSMDNWVHACVGSSGGSVRSPEKPGAAPVVLRNRGIRFRPDQPGSLEPTSGGGQFALAADDWGHWFTNTNSQHLRQIVLPDHYLRRNPFLAVSDVTVDIPDHGAACKVFRISPFEAWRVERTKRRKADPAMRARLPETELVPGGFVTSGCSPVVYTADSFPADYRGNTFMCDPANNLIHRDKLEPNGALFKAVRADHDREFLASTDNWFRPVCLTIGPDGALYVADFYREAIETPLSLPEDIKRQVNVETCGRGRIWRISRNGHKPSPPTQIGRLTPGDLVASLESPNPWRRLTAQRLIVERQSKEAMPLLIKLFETSASPQGRAHALWTLSGLNALPAEAVQKALADPSAGVRIQGLILAESMVANSPTLQGKMAAAPSDSDPMVRFQAAFSLGALNDQAGITALAGILSREDSDSWTLTAALSSTNGHEIELLRHLFEGKEAKTRSISRTTNVVRRLCALVASKGREADLAACLSLLSSAQLQAAFQAAILEGVAEGMARSGRSLDALWNHPPKGLEAGIESLRKLIVQAGVAAVDAKLSSERREAAIQMLRSGPFATVREPLTHLLEPTQPLPLQLAAIRALAARRESQVADILLEAWASAGPAARREMVEAQFARKDRVAALLNALEKGTIRPADLDPARREQLKRSPEASVRARAAKLLQSTTSQDRQKVLDGYRTALKMESDTNRGKAVFKRVCSTCHRLESVGNEVGPDLLSALRTKTAETLLADIFDPSKEVDPRFLNYQVTLRDGRTLTGMVATESANSITLRRAEKSEDTILRNQIDQIVATTKSLMPENLETQLSRQEFADVVAYLLLVAGVH